MSKIIKEIKSVGIDEFKDDKLYIIKVDIDNREDLYKLRDEIREIVPLGIITNANLELIECEEPFNNKLKTEYVRVKEKKSFIDKIKSFLFFRKV